MFWRQSMGTRADETLEFDDEDHNEDLVVKYMSGGGT